MYTPQKIVLTNFSSHKNTEYTFPQNKTSLLCGINETDDGQQSNGSGKSWLIEGLFFAIIGDALRKIKDEELIFWGEKSCEVELTFVNKVKNETLKIWRKVYSNTKSSELKIYDNSEEHKKDITSVNEGNKFILEKLGLSREDIINYFIISKEKYTSFFNSSDTAKKELINRFSKANIIDITDDLIKDDIKVHEDKVNGLQRSLDTNKAKIETYKEYDLNDKEQQIQALKESIDQLNNDNQSYKADIESKQQELNFKKQELSQSNEILNDAQPKFDDIASTKKEYEALLDEYERHVNNEVECPKCSHKFSLKDKALDIGEIKDSLQEIHEAIKDLMFEQQMIEKNIEGARDSKKFCQNEIDELEYSIKRLNSSIRMNNNEIEDLNNQIEKLQNSDSKIKIDQLEKENVKIEKDLQKTKKQVEKCEEWLINFKRFKGFIANKSLAAIESYTNFYLQQLKSNISVKFEGFKELKGGKIREQINTSIKKNGVDTCSFYALSGGEKARIEIAIILAMQKLINMASEGLGLNFIVLDEILESLDSEGLQNLLHSLNELNLNIILVTHGNIEINYPHIIIVKKVKGISIIN